MKDLDIFASEFVQKTYAIDVLLDCFFEFNHVHFLDIWLGEAEFNLTMKRDLSLGSLTFSSSRILSGLSSIEQWILHSKDPLSIHIDTRLDKNFQIFAATWLIEPTMIEDRLHGDNVPCLHYAQSVAGAKLLQCLEKTLSSSMLSRLGAETLKALIRILLVTICLVMFLGRRFHSSVEFHDRQQQLVRVLAYHMLNIGERLHCFESIDKEVFIKNIASYRYIGSKVRLFTPGLFTPLPQKSESKPYTTNYLIRGYHSQSLRPKGHSKADNLSNQHSMSAINAFRDATIRRDQPLEKTSDAIPPALDQRTGDISQPTLYVKADDVSELRIDYGIVQRHATAKSPYLAYSQPEDGHWTFSGHDKIDFSTSTSTAVVLPELQPDTICGWCGCLQISNKPSQGVVSCDGCFTPYQPNGLAAMGWGFEEYQRTEPSVGLPSGLNDNQGDLVNHASRPEVTTLGSHGNELEEFYHEDN